MGLNRWDRVSLTADPSGTPRALVWRSGRLTDISGGVTGTRAGQVNDLGQVLVRRRPTGGHDVWSFGSFTPIVAPGNAFNEAVTLNNRGRVTGSWHAPTSGGGFRIQAFTWYRGTFTDLGSLAGGQTQGRGLNESAQLVGVSQMPGGADHAFIWQNGTMRDLGTSGVPAPSRSPSTTGARWSAPAPRPAARPTRSCGRRGS
jgi:probable HAF family extracellular repeat protein